MRACVCACVSHTHRVRDKLERGRAIEGGKKEEREDRCECAKGKVTAGTERSVGPHYVHVRICMQVCACVSMGTCI